MKKLILVFILIVFNSIAYANENIVLECSIDGEILSDFKIEINFKDREILYENKWSYYFTKITDSQIIGQVRLMNSNTGKTFDQRIILDRYTGKGKFLDSDTPFYMRSTGEGDDDSKYFEVKETFSSCEKVNKLF